MTSSAPRLVKPFVAGVIATLTLAACGQTQSQEPGAGDGEPVYGGVLKASMAHQPASLDPLQASTPDQYFAGPIYDQLIFTSPNMEPQPGLAESWEFTDPTTLVLHLRSGVEFHDGTPFDAEAVKFNIERAMADPTSSPHSDFLSIDSVEATDAETVTINLRYPDTSLIGKFGDRSGYMASPTAVEELGDDYARNPVGTGPFKLVSYAPGSSIKLERNPDYWQEDLPYLDGLEISFMPDSQTAVNALRSNEIQFANYLDAQNIAALEAASSIVVDAAQSMAVDLIYINQKPPLDSPDARRAMRLALDNEAFAETIYFGAATAVSQPFPPSYWAYDEAIPDTIQDLEEARKLAASSGLEGQTIELMMNIGWDRKAQIIQSQLKEIGVNVEINYIPPSGSEFFADGKGHMYSSLWSGRPDPASTYAGLMSSDSYFNPSGYQPEGMDVEELLSNGVVDEDHEARVEAYRPLVEMANEETLYIPLSANPIISGMSEKVGGYEARLSGKYSLAFLWLEE